VNQTVIWRHFYFCDTDSDNDNEIDTVQTGCTRWTDCTHTRPTRAIIQSFTRCGGRVRWVETERSAVCHGRMYEHWTFSCSSLKLCSCWWKRRTCYHQYLDMLDEGNAPLPDVTMQELYLFVSVTAMLGGSLVTTAWRVLRLRMEETPSSYGGKLRIYWLSSRG
jgi:hypothetical protein